MGRSSRRKAALILGTAWLITMLAASSAATPNEHRRLAEMQTSTADYRAALRAQRSGDRERARDLYVAALAKDPGFVEAMVNLARISLELGDIAGADAWLDRASDERLDYPAVHAVRGLVALERNDAALAVRELERARKLAPADVEVLTNLGAALTRQGLGQEAIETLLLAVRIDPHLQSATLNLAIAYDQRGDRQRAAYYYSRFLEVSTSSDPDREIVGRRLAELRGETIATELNPRDVSHTIADALAPAGGPQQ